MVGGRVIDNCNYSVKGIHEIASHCVRSIAWSKESNATYSELVKIVAFVLTLNFKKISSPNRITNGIQKQSNTLRSPYNHHIPPGIRNKQRTQTGTTCTKTRTPEQPKNPEHRI